VRVSSNKRAGRVRCQLLNAVSSLSPPLSLSLSLAGASAACTTQIVIDSENEKIGRPRRPLPIKITATNEGEEGAAVASERMNAKDWPRQQQTFWNISILFLAGSNSIYIIYVLGIAFLLRPHARRESRAGGRHTRGGGARAGADTIGRHKAADADQIESRNWLRNGLDSVSRGGRQVHV
jgi:hypothetical protein